MALAPKLPTPETKDPWALRSEMMKCGTCMYFRLKLLADGHPSSVGRCRRRCPTMSGYPVVYITEGGCGEHKLDENAA